MPRVVLREGGYELNPEYVPPIYRIARRVHGFWRDYQSWKFRMRSYNQLTYNKLFDDR